MQKRARALLCIIFITVAILCLSASADTQASFIESVTVTHELDAIEISAILDKELVDNNKDNLVYLFELPSKSTTDDVSALSPIGEKKIAERLTFNTEFKKRSVYSYFLLATQNPDGTYTPITARKAVDNPEILAKNTADYPVRPTKKGLAAQITSDAQHLGVAHTIISIEIDEYMSPIRTGSTIPFTRYGQTFYFYEDKLSALDHKVKVYTDAGINVYFNIVLGNSELSELDFMYLGKDSPSASLYAINTKTEPSSRYFTVFCEYFAERYSAGDKSNGFVPAYILGYEVNSTDVWNYAGSTGFDDYVKAYESAYRILHTALKSTYSNAKAFVSVSNLFNAKEDSTDYGAREFLTAFAASVKAHGDIDWALAVNPYPSDTALTEFWLDTKAEDSTDTEYLTMKNLGVLTYFMRLENMLFDDDVRDIIISEFGVHGDPADARNNDCQAAAYALAYAIADSCDDIDAFLYYRHVDHPAESVHLGLWSSNALSPLTPESKKAIYTVFRDSDTANYAHGLEMARAFAGDELFEKLLGNYTPEAKRLITDAVPMLKSDIRGALKERVLFDLTLGDFCGFYPSDNSSYVELRPTGEDDYSTALYSHLNPESALTYSGISRSLTGVDLSRAQYITLSFTPVTTDVQTLTCLLMLDSDANGRDLIYEGIVQLNSNAEAELTFKLSDYIKATGGKIDTLKLWYKPSSGVLTDGEYGLWLKKVTVHEKTGLSLFVSILVTVLKVIFTLSVIALCIFAYAYKPLRNKIKGIIGKTRSKIIGFLKDKKIISRRHKKKKGAKITPPKSAVEYANKQTLTKLRQHTDHRSDGVRIVNGRVLPRQSAEIKRADPNTNGHTQGENKANKDS
ncbi:MAG: hypothetical protein J6V93_01795 [Clostridia bacterium]|nr:hypothetical protein [Clostridia bacterium]